MSIPKNVTKGLVGGKSYTSLSKYILNLDKSNCEQSFLSVWPCTILTIMPITISQETLWKTTLILCGWTSSAFYVIALIETMVLNHVNLEQLFFFSYCLDIIIQLHWRIEKLCTRVQKILEHSALKICSKTVPLGNVFIVSISNWVFCCNLQGLLHLCMISGTMQLHYCNHFGNSWPWSI